MNTREIYAVFFVIVFLLLFCTFLLRTPDSLPVSPIVTATAGTVLWKDRTFEVVLQGFIVLSGVVSILLLLVSRTQKEDAS